MSNIAIVLITLANSNGFTAPLFSTEVSYYVEQLLSSLSALCPCVLVIISTAVFMAVSASHHRLHSIWYLFKVYGEMFFTLQMHKTLFLKTVFFDAELIQTLNFIALHSSLFQGEV